LARSILCNSTNRWSSEAVQAYTRARELAEQQGDAGYPGAHAVISAAGAEVLISFFRTHDFAFSVTSKVMPGSGSIVHKLRGCGRGSNAELHLCRCAFPLRPYGR
jgi:hypothetical protein